MAPRAHDLNIDLHNSPAWLRRAHSPSNDSTDPRHPVLDKTLVVQRTDWNTRKVQAPFAMCRNASLPQQPPRQAAGADDSPPVPLEVFYVMQTTGEVIGRRQHRICPPLYETPDQAQVELLRLRVAASGSSSYSVWKAATYVDPAAWLYDVVTADGTTIRFEGSRRGGQSAAAG
jgi:hypothetical protein